MADEAEMSEMREQLARQQATLEDLLLEQGILYNQVNEDPQNNNPHVNPEWPIPIEPIGFRFGADRVYLVNHYDDGVMDHHVYDDDVGYYGEVEHEPHNLCDCQACHNRRMNEK